MKKQTIYSLWMLALSLFSILQACQPENEKMYDVRNIDVSKITRVELKPENNLLIADGRASINLTPIVYIKVDTNEIRLPNDRLKDEWFEYSSSAGQKIEKNFSTSDKSLIGKEIDVKVALKGTSLVSNVIKFSVVGELEEAYRKEISFPVVFHIIREKGEEQGSGLKLEKELFYKALEKFNIAFSGKSSVNPVGVDTKITFKPAIYKPSGEKFAEPGINRVTVDAITGYDKVVEDKKLIWNPQQYLNIWIVSDQTDGSPMFLMRFLGRCVPKYKYPTAQNTPEGLSLKNYGAESTFSLYESGILYKLQDFMDASKSYYFPQASFRGANELVHYIGVYFGLKETNKARSSEPANDYCDDTVGYYLSGKFYKKNETMYKETPEYFFLSENIMDDPSGMHKSVSKEQARRMRWVIENCPERASWKSSHAFTGK